MRKLSLSLAALALVALFSVAANKPAHAYQLNGCTSYWVEGHMLTAKVVDPGHLSNTTIFTEGCQVGVLLTHGGQTVNNVTVIGTGDYNTTAGIVVTGSFSSYLTHDTVTNAAVGIFVDYSTTYINYATLTGNDIGLYGYTGNTGKLTLSNSNIFSNLVGVDYYLSHVTASYNNIHENYFGGLGVFGGYGSSSHDQVWGNQGVGVFSNGSFGGFTLAYDNVYSNGYGNPCSYNTMVVECTGNSICIYFLGFSEEIDNSDISNLYSGVYAEYSKVTLNHTLVRYNYQGVRADGFGTVVYIYNYSTVCVNHHGATDNNFEADNGATISVSSTSHVCIP